MIKHRGPLEDQEQNRLAELQCFNVLDTPAEPGFDGITRLASQIYDVPIALVSLIDESRQWFKSRVGLDATETPRDISFCTHAIQYTGPFIVGNAVEHDLFRNNPLVTGEPFIRFYAGAPLLVSNGQNLGTLCIIDHQPRVGFTEADAECLVDLAKLVVGQLELRRANAGLAEAETRLNHVKEATAQFLSNASHEIRTPLAAMSSLMEIAVADAENQVQRDKLRQIQSINQVLLEISDGVLDVSVIDSGRLRREKSIFNVLDVIDQVIDLLRFRAEIKNLNVMANVASDVPPKIRGDQRRLFQVLVNLVNNAIKFTGAGSVTVNVAVKHRRARAVQLIFSVHDTGIGISADKCQAIFEEFTQVGDVDVVAPGSVGLGLAISRRLVSLMGGQLSVRSTVGRGSTFSFDALFDLVKDQSLVDEPDDRRLADVPDLSGVRVLLVDDNDIIRMVLTIQLERMGATVNEVTDGAAAVQSAATAESAHDIVIMDIEMPGMDGIEATRRIRETTSKDELPIVGLSAHLSPDMEQLAYDAGMNAYFRKPLELLPFATTIQTLVGGDSDSVPISDKPPVLDPSVETQTRHMFRDRYADTADRIRSAIDEGRLDEAEGFLHALRGAASFLGLRNLAETTKRLESAIKWRAVAEVPAILETFDRQFGAWLENETDGEWREVTQAGRDITGLT